VRHIARRVMMMRVSAHTLLRAQCDIKYDDKRLLSHNDDALYYVMSEGADVVMRARDAPMMRMAQI